MSWLINLIEKLYLLKDGVVFTEYSVAFSANPEGHKQQEGDERTPDGLGVDPGGAIMIHGRRNWLGWLAFFTQRFDWTDGCIAVTNGEMDEIWQTVTIPTPIEIRE